ncbi:MAG: DUF5947 family protein [Jatrophihabitans sp.]
MSSPRPGSGAISLLQKIASSRPAPAGYERCEMCGEQVADEHGHVVNLTSRNLMCTCRPCTLLFAYDEANLRYRAVPEDYVSFPGLALPPALWDDLQIPVGLVFLFHNSALSRTVAFYPGPAGATESELPLGAWDSVVTDHPALAVARPDVEALLLRAVDDDNGERTGVQCYLVPIDRCYELIGRLRQGWRGFDGGQQARAQLVDFFADLDRRSRPVEASGRLRPGP